MLKKLHTRVVMNSAIGSTLGPWMWDHSIILKLLKFYRHKNILQVFSQISKFDNLIQHYPKFYGIPTLVNPRVGDNIFLSQVVLLD